MDAHDSSWSSSSLPYSYPSLLHPDHPSAGPTPLTNKCCFRWISLAAAAVVVLCLLFAPGPQYGGESRTYLVHQNGGDQPELAPRSPISRGSAEGVSEKSVSWGLRSAPVFPWTGSMLSWQRTAFHFQPQENWMNDPNGPTYYKGWYHLFYQYNPDSAVWGNITWGHAVSKDLVHWLYLPLAMVPDRWYDVNGVWTGSATILPDGRLAMLYTGATADSVQVQNLAFPADPEDPLLLGWVKSDANPVLVPPPGVGAKDFRDPTTAWFVPALDAWLLAIGSKNDTISHTGIMLVYKTVDFVRYELLPGVLHAVEGTGMWECVDFYPVSTEEAKGLDTSTAAGAGVKHVLKASMDDDRHDYYAIGTYDAVANTWVPDKPEKDVGIGLRYDWGIYYASKTFYDPMKQRRLLWSWIGETDSELADLQKGWASLQGIPRTVLFDHKTGSNLLQWPVEEVEQLRLTGKEFSNISLTPGSVVALNLSRYTQLDIVAEFTVADPHLSGVAVADVGYNCSTSAGAADRGVLGPFGFLVLADDDLEEQTAVYFYVSRRTDGGLSTHFCHDELRSTVATDIVKRIYGSVVPVLEDETLTVRILVDHSIVESFAQGGRSTITSRVYPTKANYGAARLFLFNNATGIDVTAKSVSVWQMNSAFIRPFNDHDQSSATSIHTSIFQNLIKVTRDQSSRG